MEQLGEDFHVSDPDLSRIAPPTFARDQPTEEATYNLHYYTFERREEAIYNFHYHTFERQDV